MTCCVDLDRTAVNTTTNATETRRWVRERGFKSLIVVTSNYHMPRAMAELSHQLPDISLIAFPVVSDRLKSGWAEGSDLAAPLQRVCEVYGCGRTHAGAGNRPDVRLN